MENVKDWTSTDYFRRIQAECARRRKRLSRRIGARGILLLRAAPQSRFSNDVDHIYRQDSDFAYLTDLCEDRAIMALAPGCGHGDYLLFCLPDTEAGVVWEGRRVGLRRARRDFGADAAFAVEEFTARLPELLKGREHVYCNTADADFLGRIAAACARSPRSGAWPRRFNDAGLLLHEMRLLKSPLERRLLRAAAGVSIAAHRRAWRCCRPGVREYELAAGILHEYNRHGMRPAYPPIVAGGKNACVLHYTKNTDALKRGDLLLIDAGAECRMYASDITRTIPVSGRFSGAQKDLYQIVLDAQQSAIARAQAGNDWNVVHAAAVRAITRGLVELGLLRGAVGALIKKRAYAEFFMHGTGHWLGMDVHDAGAYFCGGKPRRFEAGMVITVEPGVYVRSGTPVRQLRNTGVRIEDDVLITASEPRILTAALPKEADEIERAMAESGGAG